MPKTTRSLIGGVLFLLSSFAMLAIASAGESFQGDHVVVSLKSPEIFGSGPQTLAVHFQPDPGWHLYWKNPGDSGASPKFSIASSEAKIGEIQWPAPVRLPYGDLTNLGYKGEIAFPFSIFPLTATGRLRIEAKLEWLVCKEECIPGFATLSVDRSIGSKANWKKGDLELVESFANRVPVSEDQSPWELISADIALDPTSINQGSVLVLNVAGGRAAPEIYPTDPEYLSPAVPTVEKTDNGYQFRFKVSSGRSNPKTTGFVVSDARGSWEMSSVGVNPVQPATPENFDESSSFFVSFLFAILGGAILNLMPCVLPVLSIKVLSLVNSTNDSRARVNEGLLYSLGVLVAFATLGGVFLLLRAAGERIGWGFHLQSPLVVLTLIVLFWLMALNFLGVFELGASVMNLAGRNHSASAFSTGILSVFVAAPCTGPFMGSALGAAATLPAFQAMLLFVGLGIGLASPFLLLAVSPSLLRLLPKPGLWMDRLKQFFAFPLFATVLWLLWVLELQAGSAGWLGSASLLLVISFSLWMGRSSRRGFVRAAAWALTILVSIAIARLIVQQNESAQVSVSQNGRWKAYSPSEVEASRNDGKPVFIDFTAAWCITCQVNKRTVLDGKVGQELFAANGVELFRADWTKQDPVITKALAELGRNSVPVYAFYAKGSTKAKLLPQILTVSDIAQLFSQEDSK